MHPRRSPLHTAALAAATTAAAGLGFWWWTSAAPETPEGARWTDISVEPAAPAATRYPSPAEVLTYDTLPIEDRLPDTGDILYRDSGAMTSNTVFDYDGPISAGTELALQFICAGSGTVQIEIILPDNTDTYQSECDSDQVESIEFSASGTGYSSVRISAPDAYLVGIAFQLVLMP
jgi:hypothetical protein